MNAKKLLKLNLSRPIAARIHVTELDIAERIYVSRQRITFVQIHEDATLRAKLEAMRHADEIMNRICSVSAAMPDCHIEHRGRLSENEYVAPYAFHVGSGIESNLAKENDSFASLYKSASDKAFDSTQSLAAGSHSKD